MCLLKMSLCAIFRKKENQAALVRFLFEFFCMILEKLSSWLGKCCVTGIQGRNAWKKKVLTHGVFRTAAWLEEKNLISPYNVACMTEKVHISMIFPPNILGSCLIVHRLQSNSPIFRTEYIHSPSQKYHEVRVSHDAWRNVLYATRLAQEALFADNFHFLSCGWWRKKTYPTSYAGGSTLSRWKIRRHVFLWFDERIVQSLDNLRWRPLGSWRRWLVRFTFFRHTVVKMLRELFPRKKSSHSRREFQGGCDMAIEAAEVTPPVHARMQKCANLHMKICI